MIKEKLKEMIDEDCAQELVNKIQEEQIKLKEICLAQSDLIDSLQRKNKRLESLLKYKNEDILKKLISIVDDIDLCEESENLPDGIKVIFNKFKKILDEFELKEFDNSDYKEFNDELHNAIDIIKYDSDLVPNNYIDEVCRKGYRYKDKILRHADVIVTK